MTWQERFRQIQKDALPIIVNESDGDTGPAYLIYVDCYTLALLGITIEQAIAALKNAKKVCAIYEESILPPPVAHEPDWFRRQQEEERAHKAIQDNWRKECEEL